MHANNTNPLEWTIWEEFIWKDSNLERERDTNIIWFRFENQKISILYTQFILTCYAFHVPLFLTIFATVFLFFFLRKTFTHSVPTVLHMDRCLLEYSRQKLEVSFCSPQKILSTITWMRIARQNMLTNLLTVW